MVVYIETYFHTASTGKFCCENRKRFLVSIVVTRHLQIVTFDESQQLLFKINNFLIPYGFIIIHKVKKCKYFFTIS